MILTGLGALVLAGAGTYGVVVSGWRPIVTLLFVVGWIGVAVMLLDYPVASTFTSQGVVRRMILRRAFYPWRDGDSLSRARPRALRFDRRYEHGGLVLMRGRRRYLLVDRLESEGEYDDLVDVVEVEGTPGDEVMASMLSRPSSKVPPTWLYRRTKWRPDWATGR
ncbi:MAG: hypothetical protein CSA55_05415 [Ilumatobacter coccineus]|uniref:PH domain-containing protein n=1 Tax=Ilumatobacter coccineus TaxID=467094 RepID=A0A2G6K7D6_9ACTN|nr:MAG: hypothetical protein CSA55_05415 [Ilumatobacter coccineus]